LISPDDTELAAGDPELPGLATLLDEGALTAALRKKLPHLAVGEARSTYARYKPGKSCVVAYRLRVDGVDRDVYARAETRESFTRRVASGVLGDPRASAPTVVLAEAAAVVRAAASDRRLPVLAELQDRTARRELLATALPDLAAAWPAVPETVRYWPERRCTARLVADGGPVVALKAYADAAYPRARGAAVAFPRQTSVRLPRLLGRSDCGRLLAFEWLPGRPLAEAIGAPEFDVSTLAPVGAALAGLQAGSAPSLPRTHPESRIGFIAQRLAWIAAVCESQAKLTERLRERLSAALAGPSAAIGPTHGDFSPTQILVDGDQLSIIDLDDAALDDPGIDLASFVAHLERRTVSGELAPQRRNSLAAALIDGYRAAIGRDLDLPRLRCLVAAELVGRAPGAFRRREPRWRAGIAALLDRAQQILDEM
jgi:hypothetical protein